MPAGQADDSAANGSATIAVPKPSLQSDALATPSDGACQRGRALRSPREKYQGRPSPEMQRKVPSDRTRVPSNAILLARLVAPILALLLAPEQKTAAEKRPATVSCGHSSTNGDRYIRSSLPIQKPSRASQRRAYSSSLSLQGVLRQRIRRSSPTRPVGKTQPDHIATQVHNSLPLQINQRTKPSDVLRRYRVCLSRILRN